jgi:carbohydrate kinase (thermoresistant glucokinase family)
VLRRPEARLVYLRGSRELIAPRIAARKDHYFKPGMLDSQFAALEEPSADENVITVSVAKEPEEIVEEIIAAI